MTEKLSAFVTTYNNEATLDACLESLSFADEIVVLDSFSTDRTPAIAAEHGAAFFQETFKGYGPQKQSACDKTSHKWVLLLDSDEALSKQGRDAVKAVLAAGPSAAGYALPRIEQMFWRMQSPLTRVKYYLRFYDKTRGRLSNHTVHESPVVDGAVKKIDAPILHYGNPNIDARADKMNAYSAGAVADKLARGRKANPWMMVFYPPVYFCRQYFIRREFSNGWAGFINSVFGAYYVFLKYAKLYEHFRRKRANSAEPPQEGK